MVEPMTGSGDKEVARVAPLPRDPPLPPGYVDPLAEGELAGDVGGEVTSGESSGNDAAP